MRCFVFIQQRRRPHRTAFSRAIEDELAMQADLIYLSSLQVLAKFSHDTCVLDTSSSRRGLDAISSQMLTDVAHGMEGYTDDETRKQARNCPMLWASLLLELQNPRKTS